MGLVCAQIDVVFCLKLSNFISLRRRQGLSKFNQILLALSFEVLGGDAEVVEAIAVKQLAILVEHAQDRARRHLQLVLKLELFQHLYHLQRFECVAFDFAKIFTEQLGSFFIAAKQEDLGYFGLILQLTIIVVIEGGGGDDFDELVILDLIELAS